MKQIETQHARGAYEVSRAGGRIKTAGASMQHLYDAAAPLVEAPSNVDAAFEANRNFSQLRKNPPVEITRAFFPQDVKTVKAALAGAGVYRPTIKTDQGPAGNFAPFYVGNGSSQLEGRIVGEQGVAIVESFLQKRLTNAGLSADSQDRLETIVQGVQEGYGNSDYGVAYERLMELREFGEVEGIETTRRANVGRSEFFFCRPVETAQQVEVSEQLVEDISHTTNALVQKVESLAESAKRLVQSGLSIVDAIRLARDVYQDAQQVEPKLIYFQPDVLLRNDGSFEIERVNFPDLGMFITQITPHPENEILAPVQIINEEIKEEVMDTVGSIFEGDVITLVTRDEVITEADDSLEQLEIQAIREALVKRGKNVQVVALGDLFRGDVSRDPLLLMNLSTNAPDYERLLHAYAKGEISGYPDPFVKLFEAEATTFPRNTIVEPVLRKFLEVIRPSAMDKPQGVYEKGRLIDQVLEKGGTHGDIIYFSVPGMNGRQIPTFRYDPKSFFEVEKTIRRLEEQGGIVDQLTATAVPFRPEDAVMIGDDGPRLAVFRFMFRRGAA